MLQTIGSDMEVFAVDEVGHGIALCGKIGGQKGNPLSLKGLPEGFGVQEDNVALEFNIPPCQNKASFVRSMRIMRGESEAIIKNLGFKMSNKCSMTFEKTQLTHPLAMIFGCEPDYSAWTVKENPRPETDNKQLRTAGGHIHLGTNSDMVITAKMMDLFLGVPSILFDDSPNSQERRKLYGKAGAMRPKPYGLEYRTLSNFWLFSDDLIEWVYESSKRACRKEDAKSLISNFGDRIQKCINIGDKEEALKIIREVGIELPGTILEPQF